MKTRLEAVNVSLATISVLIQCLVALTVSVSPIWTSICNSPIFCFLSVCSDIVMKTPMFLAVTEMNFPANILFASRK